MPPSSPLATLHPLDRVARASGPIAGAPIAGAPQPVLEAAPVPASAPVPTPLHAAVLDRDRGFGNLLRPPARALGWKLAELAESPTPDALARMGLDVLLVDVGTIAADFAWLERQARATPKLTILAYSAQSTVEQRVRGLRAGLDGWISRDCDPREVLARVQAIVRARRGRRVAASAPVHSGELHVDATRYDVLARGRSAGLTTREFEILALLVEHRGAALTRERIYEGVWGSAAPSGERSVDIFVSRIRLKLRRLSPGWRYLHTHVGVGYRFEAERDAAGGRPSADGLAAAALEGRVGGRLADANPDLMAA